MGNKETLERIYKPVIEALEKEIASGVPPWRKPWKVSGKGGSAFPKSGATGKPYRGANAFILSMVQSFSGFTENEWFTYKGALKEGHPVRKGEKGCHIFSSPFQIKKTNEISGEEEILGIAYRSFVVFNKSQCGEITEESESEIVEEEYTLSGESRILGHFRENLEMKIRILEQDSAFYRPATDEIVMPKPEQFPDWESFDGVLLHEAAHWTKEEKRLNRNYPYAHEELVAELASTFGAYRKGIRCNFPNSASYLQGWLDSMKKDTAFLHKCFQDASRAIDYLFPELVEDYSSEEE